MDPIVLATLTSGATVLAAECAKGAASEAGKDVWTKIKSLFGWKKEPQLMQLAPTIAQRLQADADLARKLVDLLQQDRAGTASTLVGTINADKVVVARKIDTVNM
jgi:hypothetical protein